jgi:hypothetical protein
MLIIRVSGRGSSQVKIQDHFFIEPDTLHGDDAAYFHGIGIGGIRKSQVIFRSWNMLGIPVRRICPAQGISRTFPGARIAAGKFTSVLGADGRRGSFEESAAYWRKRCSRIGCGAGGWADGVIAKRDQMAVRIMQGLVSMTGKYSKNQIEKVCVKAALHGQYRLSDLKSWISSPQNQESFSFMESHEIIRQPRSYDQSIGSKELFDGN